MTHSQATLINRIRFTLGNMPWEWESAGTAASTSSVIAVTDGTDWTEGDVMEIIDAVTGVTEIVHVSSVSSNNVTGVRGYYGSTAAAHVTSSRLLKNPKYKELEIINAISYIIQVGLPWPRIYKVSSTAITPDSLNTIWYDLAADALGLVSAFQIFNDSVTQYGQHHHYNRINFERNLPSSLVTSGVGVAFPDGFTSQTNNVFINYAAKITDTVSATAYSDFSDGDAVTEAIIMGAAAFLSGNLDIRRPRHSTNQTDPDTLRSSGYFNRLYHSAVYTAEKELRVKTPLMHPSGRIV